METYTIITFAPVQGFIEKSRKLRDLYGSSFILSYLAKKICLSAREYFKFDESNPAPGQKDPVVSPAIINVTQGTPNQIVIRGNFPREKAELAFNETWKKMTYECRCWVEETCKDWIEEQRREWIEKQEWESKTVVPWTRDWELWTNHAWEFFYATGGSISEARNTLNEIKRSRNWIAVNWIGESSTLSGADAIAWPGLDRRINPKQIHQGNEDKKISEFYQYLSEQVGKAFIDFIAHSEDSSLTQRYGRGLVEFAKRFSKINLKMQQDKYVEYGSAIINPEEQISIPELVKRLITLESIAQKRVGICLEEIPVSYRDLSRLAESSDTKSSASNGQEPDLRWTGWFLGDGDRVGKHLQELKDRGEDEEESLNAFSRRMMKWGENALKPAINETIGQMIYAGGDDFFGIFYRTPPKPDFLRPLIKDLSNKLTETSPELLDKVEKFQALVSKRGLHKTISIPKEIQDGFVSILTRMQQESSQEFCQKLENADLTFTQAIRLFNQPVLTERECLGWLYKFKSFSGTTTRSGTDIWSKHEQDITVSAGFVWAAPSVPQRDIIQHCNEAEKSAKKSGRDRLALRILFRGGNYLEWVCPWGLLEPILTGYQDRNKMEGEQANWGHINEDANTLKSRHALTDDQTGIAEALFKIYFPNLDAKAIFESENLFNSEERTGILGGKNNYTKNGEENGELELAAVNQAVNNWVANLAQVGFHFFRSY